MNSLTSYLSFPLLQDTGKSCLGKDLLILPLYLLCVVVPIVMAKIFPFFLDYFFLFIIVCMGVYYQIGKIINESILPFKGKVHFSEEGLALNTDNGDQFIPYEDILKINIYYQGYTPQLNLLPFQIAAHQSLFNVLEIVQRRQILRYNFYSVKREDENKLDIVIRKIIPREVDCLFEVKNDVEIRRINGGMIREKRSLVQTFKNSLDPGMNIFTYVQLAILIVFIAGIFYYFLGEGEVLAGILVSLVSVIAIALIHSSRN